MDDGMTLIGSEGFEAFIQTVEAEHGTDATLTVVTEEKHMSGTIAIDLGYGIREWTLDQHELAVAPGEYVFGLECVCGEHVLTVELCASAGNELVWCAVGLPYGDDTFGYCNRNAVRHVCYRVRGALCNGFHTVGLYDERPGRRV